MLHAVLLAAAIAAAPGSPVPAHNSSIQQCFASMDGAVYHGDPTDRASMKANVAACAQSIADIKAMRPATAAQGPEKLFITGRILERAATLSFMGLGDAATALREVKMANLYFRVAAGLPDQPALYREAAAANAALTVVQLQTLRTEIASQPHVGKQILTAYHKQ